MFQTFKKLFARKQTAARQRRQARPSLEAFEPRDLPSAGPVLIPAAHQLVIVGTQGADNVRVGQSGGRLIVNFDGRVYNYSSAGISRVLFSGGIGDDTFVNRTSLRTIANGGNGDDTLIGGRGNDWLAGGAGNDDLRGEAGDDRLDGNAGDDHLAGGLGHDSLNGGSGNDVGDDDGQDAEAELEVLELAANLTGAKGASGSAEAKPDGNGGTFLEVEVSGLAAGQTFRVLVGGTSVGQVTVSRQGEGKLTVDVPSLAGAAGATVTVQDSAGTTLLQGTFAAGDDHASGNHHD
jgi:Ca2+-binding RTX toxin-like protein